MKWLVFLLLLTSAAAVDLAEVPAHLPPPQRLALEQDRTKIAARWQTFLGKEAAFRQKYAGTKPGTARADEALRAKAVLEAEGDAIVADAETFNATIAALPPPDGFDPRVLVTRSEYEQAQREEARLERRRQLYRDELERMRQLGASLRQGSAEFERLQEKARIDCLEDIVLKIPAGSCFNGLAAQGILSAADAQTLTLGYDSLKLLIETGQGLSSDDAGEQYEKVVASRRSLRDLLSSGAVDQLTPASQKWLRALEGLFDGTAEALRPDKADETRSKYEQVGKALVSAGVAIVPPAALIELAFTVGEKSFEQRILAVPLAAYGQASSKNFEARRFFQQRLETTDADLAAVRETIAKFEAVR